MRPKIVSHFAALSIMLTLVHSVSFAASSPLSVQSSGIVEEEKGAFSSSPNSEGVSEVARVTLEGEKGSCCSKQEAVRPVKGQRSRLKHKEKIRNVLNSAEYFSKDQVHRARARRVAAKEPHRSLISLPKEELVLDALSQKIQCLKEENISPATREEVEKLVQQLNRTRKASQRKSARENLLKKANESKISRDHSVSSTLRFDTKKAEKIRSVRNSKHQSSSDQRAKPLRATQGEESQSASVRKVRSFSNRQVGKENKAKKSSDTAEETLSNIGDYDATSKSQCDGQDWPCSSCVSKRRAHRGISVATMVVTVIAMIISAVIIVNASDTAETTPKPNP